MSERELEALLFDIQQQARDHYETDPVQRGKSALASPVAYPLLSLDRTLAAQHFPAPADPAAALIALVTALVIRRLRPYAFGISERIFLLAVYVFYLGTAAGILLA